MRAYSHRGIRFTQTGSFGHGPNAQNMCNWLSLSYFRIGSVVHSVCCYFFFRLLFVLFPFVVYGVVSLTFWFPSNWTASAGRRCTKSRIESITSSISVHHPITFRRVDVISRCVGLYITNEEERKLRRERERGRERENSYGVWWSSNPPGAIDIE